MARKRYKHEEIVAKLRQVDVLVSDMGLPPAGAHIGHDTSKRSPRPHPSFKSRHLPQARTVRGAPFSVQKKPRRSEA
jgi:hypothetical protein